MSGEYRQAWKTYGGNIADKQLPVVDPVLIYAETSTSRIAVQEIEFNPSVFVSSVLTFLDSLTNQSIGSFEVPAVRPIGTGSMTLKFGPGGAKLSAGANLILGTTNGAAGRLHISAFQRPR
jgi:hypothetical protein